MQHTVLAISDWLDFKSFKVPPFFTGIIEGFKLYRAYNETVRELSQLSDRELKDLGIHRSMIHSIAMEIYTDNRKA